MKTAPDGLRLPAALLDAACYPHAAGRIRVIETHISWVFLTGRLAYKIKKPVNLGFVDFSTLRLRRHYCREELRLNRRFAPRLYLDVVAIRGDPRKPRIGGKGPVREYAVRMRQFRQSALASRALAAGKFGPREIDALADRIAAFHAGAAPVPAGGALGTPTSVLDAALDNFRQMMPLAKLRKDRAALVALRQWTRHEHASRRHAFEARKSGGAIRDCHGDLHLGNVALIDGEPVPFDCIEFNDQFRWIDVVSEIAFLVMELDYRKRSDLGWRFLNRYLESTGDYGGIQLLRFYLVYRALVRAKVHLMRSLQPGVAAGTRARLARAFRAYLRLAVRYSAPRRAALVIAHGLSGSGKTTATQPLIEGIGAIRLRSDVERKRLHGLAALARTDAAPGAGIYTPAATASTYRRLGSLARSIIGCGFPVVADAAFLKRSEREAFRAIAEDGDVPFCILAFRAPLEVLRSRVMKREMLGRDASEAGIAVLERQIERCESLTPAEMECALTVDTFRSRQPARLTKRLKKYLK